MEDLSEMPLATTSLIAGSSMGAGNTVNTHARLEGMAAPGSDPVDPLPALDNQDDPMITWSAELPEPSTLIKKDARPYTASPLAWKKTGA